MTKSDSKNTLSLNIEQFSNYDIITSHRYEKSKILVTVENIVSCLLGTIAPYRYDIINTTKGGETNGIHRAY